MEQDGEVDKIVDDLRLLLIVKNIPYEHMCKYIIEGVVSTTVLSQELQSKFQFSEH